MGCVGVCGAEWRCMVYIGCMGCMGVYGLYGVYGVYGGVWGVWGQLTFASTSKMKNKSSNVYTWLRRAALVS